MQRRGESGTRARAHQEERRQIPAPKQKQHRGRGLRQRHMASPSVPLRSEQEGSEQKKQEGVSERAAQCRQRTPELSGNLPVAAEIESAREQPATGGAARPTLSGETGGARRDDAEPEPGIEEAGRERGGPETALRGTASAATPHGRARRLRVRPK